MLGDAWSDLVFGARFTGRDDFARPIRAAVDLDAAGITGVVWGTGFRRDLSGVRFPILDAAGELRWSSGRRRCRACTCSGSRSGAGRARPCRPTWARRPGLPRRRPAIAAAAPDGTTLDRYLDRSNRRHKVVKDSDK